MRVLLINPPIIVSSGRKRISSVIDNLFYNSPPLGLAYIAAVLKEKGVAVSIVDAAAQRLSLTGVVETISAFAPDAIGVTATTNLFDSAVAVINRIKEVAPSIPVIIGGPHVSSSQREVFSCSSVDYAVLGEGEVTFAELIRALQYRESVEGVRGIGFRRNGDVVFTTSRPAVEDLDTLPFPARDLLPLRRYHPQPNDQHVLPKVSMITSRGCPFGCAFCDKSVFGRHYRSFSPEYIVSEMEHVIHRYGARDIAFLDSTFTVSQERVERIIDQMKKRNVRVAWTCTVRADVVTKELLRKMRDAGCWRIRLGIESANDKVLDFINKGITVGQVKNVARWAHELGLQPKGFFMLGHPVDTEETIEETISLAKELPLKDITVQINTPMKNTPQYDSCREQGTFLSQDYKALSYWEPVFVPKGLTKEYLLDAYRRFYRSFYLRPVIFWRHLRHIHRWYNIVAYIRGLRILFQLGSRRPG